MKRITTTAKINETISNNLLQVTKAEIYYKSLGTTETVNASILCESLDFLCHSGIFADAIGWHYERDSKTNGYIVECGRMNPDTEIIVIVYLDICNGACKENIEKALEVTEE
ncbi:MAG: hypothetical protein HDQ97_12055 [Lachnospiraceae bacterium]|nr:hypothetical protein [Lachnospiraceae bacterium]